MSKAQRILTRRTVLEHSLHLRLSDAHIESARAAAIDQRRDLSTIIRLALEDWLVTNQYAEKDEFDQRVAR